jgi:hypothetical protein
MPITDYQAKYLAYELTVHPRRDVQIPPCTIPSAHLHRRPLCREVDFPRQLRPRLIIEFSEGLSLLLEDHTAIPLAAEFVATFRKHLAEKGARPC